MPEPPANTSYTEFFEYQRRAAAVLTHVILAIGVAAAFIVAMLLLFLHSPVAVWGYAFVLIAVGFYGLLRLKQAAEVSTVALNDLEEIARFLHAARRRDELTNFVRSKISPDKSNVPEAIAAFCEGSRGSENVRAAANAAFAQPTSELGMAGFLRTALVLGGLFGTVLFFAFELGRDALVVGNLEVLLPGLRGALASTLTGILGSVAIGVAASRSEQILDRSIWETESFLAGPVSTALASVKKDVSVQSETDLWQSLLKEVSELSRKTDERYAAVGADIAAHSVALQKVSEQLAGLPQIVVPEQLTSLHASTVAFKDGVETLQKTSEVLTRVVQQVGVFAPTQTLQQLQSLRAEVASQGADLGSRLAGVEGSVRSVNDAVASVPGALVGVRESGDEAARTMSAAIDAVASTADRIERSIGSADAAETELSATGSIRSVLDTVRVSVEGLNARGVSALASDLDTGSSVDAGVLSKQLAADVAAVVDATVVPKVEAAVQKLERMAAREDTLVRGFSRLKVLDGIAAWHARAMKAPLMRLLLLGGGRRRQVGATNEA